MSPHDHSPLKLDGPPPFVPPRPMYFEPEEPAMCPACRNGGVCGCICFLPVIT